MIVLWVQLLRNHLLSARTPCPRTCQRGVEDDWLFPLAARVARWLLAMLIQVSSRFRAFLVLGRGAQHSSHPSTHRQHCIAGRWLNAGTCPTGGEVFRWTYLVLRPTCMHIHVALLCQADVNCVSYSLDQVWHLDPRGPTNGAQRACELHKIAYREDRQHVTTAPEGAQPCIWPGQICACALVTAHRHALPATFGVTPQGIRKPCYVTNNNVSHTSVVRRARMLEHGGTLPSAPHRACAQHVGSDETWLVAFLSETM